jgi:hypothetical protein
MKNSQKGFVVPLLLGIIALLVIGGGVYIYENNKIETPVVADNTTQQSNQVQQTNTQNSPVINQQNTSVIKTTPVSNPAPVKSSVTISSPNGQEVWVNRSQQTIRWTSKGSDATQPVEIILERKSPNDAQFWNIGTIATNQPGSGSYVWTVSSNDATGNIVANSQYKILIGRNLAKGTGPVDESDSYFLIAMPTTQPVITLLSPNGGEIWTKGMTQNITWTSPYYFRTTNVDITLVPVPMICPSGYSCMPNPSYLSRYTIASNISANQNSFNWRVGDGSYIVMSPCGPNDPIPLDTVTHLPILGSNCNRGNKTVIVPDGQYTIQICESGTNICDSSNNYFTITTANSQTVSVRISFSSINENIYSLLNNTTILGLNYLYPRNSGNNTVINAIDPTIMSMGDSCGETVQATLEITNPKIEGTHPTLHGDPTVAVDIIRVLSHDNPQRSCAY